MAISKITNAERDEVKIYGLPDKPGLTKEAMQQRFDGLGNLAIDKINEVIDNVNETEKEIKDLDTRVDQIANNQIPEEYVQSAVETYVNNNQSELATKKNLEELDNQLSSEIANNQTQVLLIKSNFDNDILSKHYDSFIYGKAITWQGEEISDDNYVRTDFIEVEPRHKLKLTTSNNDSMFIAQYGENKNFISCDNYSIDSEVVLSSITKFIIISIVKWKIGVSTLIDGTYQVQYQKNDSVLYNITEFLDTTDNILKNQWKDFTYDYVAYYNDQENYYHEDFAMSKKIEVQNSASYFIECEEAIFVTEYDIGGVVLQSSPYSGGNIVNMMDNTSHIVVSIPKWQLGKVRITPYGSLKNVRNRVVVGANENFTSFTEAINYAYSIGNCDVIVKEGAYDIVAEYGGTLSGIGLMIGNGMHIIASPQAYVTCNYEGTDDSIKTFFSVLNAGNGDFVIDGLNISAKNIRYCVHDELSSADGFRIHEYNNCNMYIDNRNSGTVYRTCIGCGLGSNTRVIVNGGYYKAEESNGQANATLLFHNGDTANCKSEVIVKDVYIDGENGNCRFGYFGNSVEITKCFVSGCNMDIPPVVIQETEQYNNVNMEMIAWNNHIRKQ